MTGVIEGSLGHGMILWEEMKFDFFSWRYGKGVWVECEAVVADIDCVGAA